MKILWITNQPIAKHRDMLTISVGQSGGWMETAYNSLSTSQNVELIVATIYNGTEVLIENFGKDVFVLLPKYNKGEYDYNNRKNILAWKQIIEKTQPNIIHIWGTEFTPGLCAQIACPNIPSVIYIQGLMQEIANHYTAGITVWDQIRFMTIKDILTGAFLWTKKRKMEKQADIEKQMILHSNNVICENFWSAEHCKLLSNRCHIYKSLLPINPLFAQYDWDEYSTEPHSIFTVAGGYPIKGHHVLLKAFKMVVSRYPDAKLYIPGNISLYATDLISRLRRSTYISYLLSYIKHNHLSSNVVFVGKLSPNQMAEKLSKSCVFVMPSCVENHSSSLIEAMMVGVPTISANVGGISDYYVDKENGLFYRYDEPSMLASHIIDIFEKNIDYIKIAKQAKEETRLVRQNINLVSDFTGIYYKILSNQYE